MPTDVCDTLNAPRTLKVLKQSVDASTPVMLPRLDRVNAIELTYYGICQGFDPAAPPGKV